MKCVVTILTVLLCDVVLAVPNRAGYGGIDGTGLDEISRKHNEFAHGNEFGGEQYNSGENGFNNQDYYNTGAGSFHNREEHHSKHTSIHEAEESDSHDVGNDSAYDNGASSHNAFNNHEDGAAEYGDSFDQGDMDDENIEN